MSCGKYRKFFHKKSESYIDASAATLKSFSRSKHSSVQRGVGPKNVHEKKSRSNLIYIYILYIAYKRAARIGGTPLWITGVSLSGKLVICHPYEAQQAISHGHKRRCAEYSDEVDRCIKGLQIAQQLSNRSGCIYSIYLIKSLAHGRSSLTLINQDW